MRALGEAGVVHPVCVDYVGAHSANILFHENDKNSRWRYTLGSQRWRSCTPERMAKAISMFEKYDVAAWAFVHRHEKRTLFVDTDFWNERDDLDSREDYVFFRKELGFVRKAGCRLNDNLCWTDNIAFQFPTAMRRVPATSISRINALLPHAAKSIELWRTFSVLKSQYNAVLSAIDHVRVGLCILDATGTLITANEEAHRILKLSSALRIDRKNAIRCRSEDMQNRIHHSIRQIAATAAGDDSVSEMFHVLGANKQALISIEVSPLRDSAGELASGFSGTLLTMIDLCSDLEIDCRKLASAYKLSKSESLVCEALIKGQTADNIAEMRNVTSETVKTQIKNIHRKTGTRGRINLIRLATKASPPIS